MVHHAREMSEEVNRVARSLASGTNLHSLWWLLAFRRRLVWLATPSDSWASCLYILFDMYCSVCFHS